MRNYRAVLAVRPARRALGLGLLIRIPMWAGGVIMTLHVVAHLHRSYSAAGLVTAVATVALAVSGPWRGRRLDHVGLRRTVLPSLLVLTACWSLAPWVGYWALLVLAGLAGLFVVPTFSIIRQVLIHAVPDDQRTAALAMDSVAVEISFMIGPAIGVLLATAWDTPTAMFTCELASVAGGALLWLVNPNIGRPESTDAAASPVRGRSWLTPAVVAVLAGAATSTVVLTGTDVGVVAALRDMGHQSSIGWMLALWGLGSAVGGIVYGTLRRRTPVFVLLALLSLATVPAAAVSSRPVLAVVLVIAGLFCAPTITATVDALSRMVPPSARGEAMGWHGSALTAGSALGAPLAGIVIDLWGWRAAFVSCGLLGLAVAAAGLTTTRLRATRRARQRSADAVDASV